MPSWDLQHQYKFTYHCFGNIDSQEIAGNKKNVTCGPLLECLLRSTLLAASSPLILQLLFKIRCYLIHHGHKRGLCVHIGFMVFIRREISWPRFLLYLIDILSPQQLALPFWAALQPLGHVKTSLVGRVIALWCTRYRARKRGE